MNQEFINKCKQVRLDILEMAEYGKRGHIASALSMVEALVILYDHVLKLDPQNPKWKNRDRFILSKGHGCMSLYSVLARRGFFPVSEFRTYCMFDSILGGHPTKEKVPGCEASTGSLGHGLSIGIGMAMYAKIEELDYKTYVMLGDGECNEGSIWEGALSASKNKLNNLIVMVDYNKYQSYSTTKEVCDLEPFAQKWEAFGFETFEVDMINKPLDLLDLLKTKTQNNTKPIAIILHSIKGQGVSFIEGNLDWHHKSKISESDLEKIKLELKI